MGPNDAWSVYTGENSFASWAKLVDCGDVPLTFLDNTVALKQLDKAHEVGKSFQQYFFFELFLGLVETFPTDHLYIYLPVYIRKIILDTYKFPKEESLVEVIYGLKYLQ